MALILLLHVQVFHTLWLGQKTTKSLVLVSRIIPHLILPESVFVERESQLFADNYQPQLIFWRKALALDL